MSSYYTKPPPGIDLMLQNVTIKTNQNMEQHNLDTCTNVLSPSSSSESQMTAAFEDNGAFSLHDINITVPKVMIL